jgi:hypothetical protein
MTTALSPAATSSAADKIVTMRDEEPASRQPERGGLRQ